MGLFSGWFRKKESEDYEQVLSALSLDIQKRQTHLSEIRLRERRATLLFSVYALALWIAYVSVWYTGYVPSLSGRPRNSSVEKFFEGLPVFVGPIVILFIRRIVQICYTSIANKEEKHLVTLRKQQREKIEEIKKKTNYNSTRTLIERYDDSASNGGVDSPLRRRNVPAPQSIPGTPQRLPPQQQRQEQPLAQLAIPQTPANAKGGIPPGLQQQLSPSPQRPMPPPRKQWYDRLADAILGDEETASGSVVSRYALICQKCFMHNGLVKESVWDTTQYVCRNCGYFNPSPKSGRRARHPDSAIPTISAAISPERSGALAPPLDQSFGAQDGPNVDSETSPQKQRSVSRPRGSVAHGDGDDAPTVLMDVDGDS